MQHYIKIAITLQLSPLPLLSAILTPLAPSIFYPLSITLCFTSHMNKKI